MIARTPRFGNPHGHDAWKWWAKLVWKCLMKLAIIVAQIFAIIKLLESLLK